MFRGFLVVKWFSVIGTAYNLMGPLFSTYLSVKWGEKSTNKPYTTNKTLTLLKITWRA